MKWACFLLLAGVAGAQPGGPAPISTDSPTVSRSSHTVGSGRGVIEVNYSFTSTRDGADPAHQLPVTARAGLTDNFELRLESNGYIWQGDSPGWADVSLGFKYEFETDWALVGLLSVPSGSPAFRANAATPFVSLAHDIPLSDEDGLLFNAGASFLPNGQTQALGTMVYSRMLQDDMAWFIETAVIGADVRMDTGLQFWPDSEWVINLAVVRGLSGGGLDWGGSLGFGARF